MSTSLFSYVAVLQAIMKVFGVYDGAIDGLWGPKCVDAIKDWARDDSFDPAIPTMGSIFVPLCRLPKGLSWVKKQGVYQIDYSLLRAADKEKVKQYLSEYKPITVSAVHDQHDTEHDTPQVAVIQPAAKAAAPVAKPTQPVKVDAVVGIASEATTVADTANK